MDITIKHHRRVSTRITTIAAHQPPLPTAGAPQRQTLCPFSHSRMGQNDAVTLRQQYRDDLLVDHPVGSWARISSALMCSHTLSITTSARSKIQNSIRNGFQGANPYSSNSDVSWGALRLAFGTYSSYRTVEISCKRPRPEPGRAIGRECRCGRNGLCVFRSRMFWCR